MSPNPVSLREDATVREAMVLLIDKGFSAAPVIDEAGRPVGVLSRSDLLIHDRENVDMLGKMPEFYTKEELMAPGGEPLGKGFQVERVDRTCINDLMTPTVFCVAPDDSVHRVVRQLLDLKVHRLFVVDDRGVLVGVISAFDVLRHLVGDIVENN